MKIMSHHHRWHDFDRQSQALYQCIAANAIQRFMLDHIIIPAKAFIYWNLTIPTVFGVRKHYIIEFFTHDKLLIRFFFPMTKPFSPHISKLQWVTKSMLNDEKHTFFSTNNNETGEKSLYWVNNVFFLFHKRIVFFFYNNDDVSAIF